MLFFDMHSACFGSWDLAEDAGYTRPGRRNQKCLGHWQLCAHRYGVLDGRDRTSYRELKIGELNGNHTSTSFV